MTIGRLGLFVSLVTLPVLLAAQSWPTYNGDYSGRRFSSLSQINSSNIGSLSLTWMHRVDVRELRGIPNVQIKSTPLEENGILYFTVPDHVWAVDARTGEQLWQYTWVDKGGHLVGNRGVGIYENWIYFMGPDGWFISLNAKDGKERWRVQMADPKLQYFTTTAPMIVGNHIVIGVGGDAMDVPGYLEARDPETGALQWRWNSEPRVGEPEADTWPNKGAMEHGGGMTWLPGTYDPELNLIYWGTGNPNPVYAAQGRKGTNLWTCSIVALNPDTGKLAWYFQASPHDTHDWDDVETPVLFDGVIHGQKRKLLAQAARNGYFFVLDRTNGKNIVSKPFVGAEWAKGVDAEGHPIPNPDTEPKTDGALLNTPAIGGTNWFAPSFDPESGLFYVNAYKGYSLAYLTDTDERPEGYGGSGRNLWAQASLEALDYKTGAIRWSHDFPGKGMAASGLLSTAGKLLFSGDPSGNLIAWDPASGRILWHFHLQAPVSNGPMTYTRDGRQYLVVGAGDTLYAFALPSGRN
ncbi:MAG: acido-empty-quinoprotein group A [Acidobacteriota bacterium]|nr:acido-empty-quinoprotein group A [Acidobacteriota bacterium]